MSRVIADLIRNLMRSNCPFSKGAELASQVWGFAVAVIAVIACMDFVPIRRQLPL
jgi:hypothetical protein